MVAQEELRLQVLFKRLKRTPLFMKPEEGAPDHQRQATVKTPPAVPPLPERSPALTL